jgi:hypothetical protein
MPTLPTHCGSIETPGNSWNILWHDAGTIGVSQEKITLAWIVWIGRMMTAGVKNVRFFGRPRRMTFTEGPIFTDQLILLCSFATLAASVAAFPQRLCFFQHALPVSTFKLRLLQHAE